MMVHHGKHVTITCISFQICSVSIFNFGSLIYIFFGWKDFLGGGNSNILGTFTPNVWGRWIEFDEHIFPDGLVQPPPSYPFSHNHGSVENRAPKWSFRNFHIGDFPSHFPSWTMILEDPHTFTIYSLGFQGFLWLSGGMTIFQIYNQPRIPWIWGQFRRCRSLHHAVGLPGGLNLVGVGTFGVATLADVIIKGSTRKRHPKTKALPLKSGGNGRSFAGVKMA